MDAAAWTIRDLLGMSPDDFTKLNLVSERYVHEGALSAARLAALLSLADIDRIAASQTLVSSMVRVHNSGRRLAVEEFTSPSGLEADAVRYVDNSKLFRCFRDGGTLTLRDMHRYWPSITKLSWDLSRQLGYAVTANGYLTPAEAQGLNPHFDYHDILVIQMAGSKEWYSYSGNAELPLDNNNWRAIAHSVDTRRPAHDTPITGSVKLEPGDVLFLPRGSNHAARSDDGISMHLTLELQEWTYFDVAASILKQVAASRRLRECLPRGSAAQIDLSREVVERALADMTELGGRIDTTDLAWALYRESHIDLFETPIPLVRQYETLSALPADQKFMRRPNLLFFIRETSAGIQVNLRDRTLTFPAEHMDIVYEAFSGRPVSVAGCVNNVTSADHARQIMLALVHEAALIPAAEG